MIYPRFLARFLAWFGGYFWLPCPACGEYFAGFEHGSGAIPIGEEDGVHMYTVCSKQKCCEEGMRRQMDYMQNAQNWHTVP